MILKLPVLAAFILVSGLAVLTSCAGKKAQAPVGTPTDSGHYSVRSYALGQVNKLYGQPIALERVYRDDDRFDSSLLPITALDWNEVISVFAKTDISAPEFVGKYVFTVSDDNLTATRVLTYTAARPDLFTRIFQINTDLFDFRVKSLYIETKESGFWKSISQKLLYSPGNIIQIQEDTDPLIGKTAHKRLEYRFTREEPDGVHIVE
jgi:hypothetical protein